MSAVGTWPVIHHDGDGVQVREAIPVTVLVAPGPEVTRATPTLRESPGVAVRGVDRGLLVAHQDVLDLGRPGEFVIDVQDHSAGITEDVLNLPLQTLQ